MDVEKFGEIVGASITTGTPANPDVLLDTVFTEDELMRAVERKGLMIGSLATAESSASPETQPLPLTPEEAAFKESLLERLKKTYRTYAFAMNVMNGARGKKAKLPVADFLVVKTAAEGFLTDDLVRGAKAEVDKFTAHPIENSPEAGFDLLPLPNTNLTGDDETALADHIQGLFASAYKGDAHVYPPFHDNDTAHQADGTKAAVTFVLAPTHLNLDHGDVAKQKADLEAHNADPDTTTYQTGNDLAAMLHIKHLADNKLIDTTTKGYVEDRFWQTYYRDVQKKPVGGFVPDVFFSDRARLYRGYSLVSYDEASRALVVPA